jgi:hypothetical protein
VNRTHEAAVIELRLCSYTYEHQQSSEQIAASAQKPNCSHPQTIGIRQGNFINAG